MQTNLRTMGITAVALLLAGTAMAPTAQAELENEGQIEACTGNPDAWVNACVTLTPITKTVNAYTLDTTPETTRVCPVNNICVNVPILLGGLIDPYTYYVTYYNVQPSVSVNPGKVVEDICDIIGIVCTLLELLASSESDAQVAPALPHGLQFEGFTVEGGLLSGAVFLLPSGEALVLPIAA